MFFLKVNFQKIHNQKVCGTNFFPAKMANNKNYYDVKNT